MAGLALSGCATHAPNSDVMAQPAKEGAPLKWRLSGRFSAKNEENSWNGSLTWDQQRDAYDIVLSAPLSQGAVALRGDSHGSELSLGSDKTYADGSAERLLLEQTGWYIPFDGLRFWLTGQTAPNIAVMDVENDADGQLFKFKQGEWLVEFKRRVRIDGFDLPNKIFLTSSAYEVRFVVDLWDLSG